MRIRRAAEHASVRGVVGERSRTEQTRVRDGGPLAHMYIVVIASSPTRGKRRALGCRALGRCVSDMGGRGASAMYLRRVGRYRAGVRACRAIHTRPAGTVYNVHRNHRRHRVLLLLLYVPVHVALI